MYNPFKSKAWEKIKFDEPEEVHEENKIRSWQVIAHTYAAPVQHVSENFTDIELIEKAIFGVTTILLQDTLTGDIRKEEIIGSDENQLFNILEKAKQFGMQYINYNGERFAIATVPVEENLPVV